MVVGIDKLLMAVCDNEGKPQAVFTLASFLIRYWETAITICVTLNYSVCGVHMLCACISFLFALPLSLFVCVCVCVCARVSCVFDSQLQSVSRNGEDSESTVVPASAAVVP